MPKSSFYRCLWWMCVYVCMCRLFFKFDIFSFRLSQSQLEAWMYSIIDIGALLLIFCSRFHDFLNFVFAFIRSICFVDRFSWSLRRKWSRTRCVTALRRCSRAIPWRLSVRWPSSRSRSPSTGTRVQHPWNNSTKWVPSYLIHRPNLMRIVWI